MSLNKTKITIGILAHVDAGKTTLTEGMLHTAGATRLRGNVDKGSAITDGLEMEKERGISIKTATVDFEWNNTIITIVDTPGHIDFSAEVDRALSVLDVVVLVVSAVEGVQANTLNLWESLQERNIPVLIFINKIDRNGADIEEVFTDLEADLHTHLFALNYADLSNPDAPKLVPFLETTPYLSQSIIEKSFENLTEYDDTFLDAILNDNLPELKTIEHSATSQIASQKLVPLLFGSAKLDMGITPLLNTITSVFKTNTQNTSSNSAKVFKVEYDSRYGRLAHIKLYSGYIKNKDSIWSQQLEKDIKINQILKRKLGTFEPVG
ncbi:GTP-binding protein, partial [Pontimicrobium sp. MEBiC01747]